MPTSSRNSGTVVFQGARVLVGDGSTTIENAAILVSAGRITAVGPAASIDVPASAEAVDLTGKTVMPTLINPHGHIGYLRDGVTSKENYSRENVLDHLRRLAYYGVSVFQSLGTDRDDTEITIRNEQRAGVLTEHALALLLTAGSGLVAPTPGSTNGGPYFATDVVHEVSTPEQARAAVRAISAKKPDTVKFWVDDRTGTKSKLAPDVYGAIIEKAHQLGHITIAHIFGLEDAKSVVRAGVDGLAHMVRDPGPDDELIAMMKEKNVFAFTSMGGQKAIMLKELAWLDSPELAETVTKSARAAIRAEIDSFPASTHAWFEEFYPLQEEGLRRYAANGIRIVLSADTGLLAQFFGIAEHREVHAMVQAGLSAQQAIQAATQTPAEVLGLVDRGTLEAGKRADLLVLDANPLDDIANTLKIHAVYLAGHAIDRARLRARWTGAGQA
ncbi:amidohydrolase family protein [Streptomyces sp. NPDC046805]|uniref:amidohydrolase family protein n=1 Tax=Streptomyces sp. NPDC046805 TaxID=3155134 RepID=UPI0033E59BC2